MKDFRPCDFTYDISDHSVVLRSYHGMDTNVVIPGEIEGLPVRTIQFNTFSFQDDITSLTIPKTVVQIENGAIVSCDGLEQVLVEPGNPAYRSEEGVLFTMDFSTLVHYPTQKGGAYRVPQGVGELNGETFSCARALTSIFIPESVNHVGGNIFHRNEGLTEILVEETNPFYKSIDGVLFSKDGTHLVIYPSGKKTANYVVPEEVRYISEFAFYDCPHLKALHLPRGLEHVGENSFTHCEHLKHLTFPEGMKKIHNTPFMECPQLRSITFPKSLTYVCEGFHHGCDALSQISVPEENPYLKMVGSSLFSKRGKTLLVTLPEKQDEDHYVVPDGVQKIGNFALQYLRHKSITLPQSVTEIGSGAFCSCISLEEIVIPASVQKIGNQAFKNCSCLKKVHIPQSITSLAVSIFENCDALESITLPENLKSVRAFAFEGCTRLKKIVLPASVKSLGVHAFYGCEALTDITIPRSVKRIDFSVFENCDRVTLHVYAGSVAEQYAKTHQIRFKRIEE